MRIPWARALAAALLGSAALAAPSALASGQPAGSWTRTPVVGLQVGHWAAQDLPDELADLRDNGGADRDGYRELDIAYAVAESAAEALRSAGVKVDVLPATVPPDYRADAFLAIHADQNINDAPWRGYKIAPSAFSQDKASSRLLAADTAGEYAAQTGLPPDLHEQAITPNMRYYYAFNWRAFKHAVDRRTPAAILELGFITDQTDRDLLFDHPDLAGRAVASGVLRFLQDRSGAF